MSNPSGHVSFGGTFAFGSGGSPSGIPGLISCDGSDLEVNKVKMGALDDSTRFWNHGSGRIDGGQLKATFEFRTTPANNFAAFAALLGEDDLTYIYTLSNGTVVSGIGSIATLGMPKSPEDDRITFDVSIQVDSMDVA